MATIGRKNSKSILFYFFQKKNTLFHSSELFFEELIQVISFMFPQKFITL